MIGTSGAEVSIAHAASATPRFVASIAVMFSGRAGMPSVSVATNGS